MMYIMKTYLILTSVVAIGAFRVLRPNEMRRLFGCIWVFSSEFLVVTCDALPVVLKIIIHGGPCTRNLAAASCFWRQRRGVTRSDHIAAANRIFMPSLWKLLLGRRRRLPNTSR